MSNIFTVTVIDIAFDNTRTDDKRCLGFFHAYIGAKNSIEKNIGEMHECKYDYAVIEEVKEGIWQQTLSETWYSWNYEDEKWAQCKKPLKYREFMTTCNFGMG